MRNLGLSKINIYAAFLLMLLTLAVLFSVWGPLAFLTALDPSSIEKLLQPSYLECVSTLKDNGIALSTSGAVCQENTMRKLMQGAALIIFAAPVVLLTVKKEILEGSKARAQKLGSEETIDAIDCLDQIANMASLIAVPIAVYLLAQVVQPYNITSMGHAFGRVLMMAGLALAFYTAALFSAMLATNLLPSRRRGSPGTPAPLPEDTGAQQAPPVQANPMPDPQPISPREQ